MIVVFKNLIHILQIYLNLVLTCLESIIYGSKHFLTITKYLASSTSTYATLFRLASSLFQSRTHLVLPRTPLPATADPRAPRLIWCWFCHWTHGLQHWIIQMLQMYGGHRHLVTIQCSIII